MPRTVFAPMVLTLSLVLACGSGEEPVASVSASPAELIVDHGRYFALQLDWQLERPLDWDGDVPVVFVHLSQPEEGVLRTFDHPLPEEWVSGRRVKYPLRVYQSALGPALEPGEYALTLGLYDGADRRWSLSAGPELGRREYQVGTVRVRESAEAVPRFQFSESWQEIEPGTNVQTLARRWMVDPGTFRVDGMPDEAKALWLRLRIPRVGGTLRLVLDEGAESPAVQVATDCDGFEATLTGAGQHEVEIPVDWPGCGIELNSNFHVVELDSLRQVVLALEQLAWR